MGGHSGRRLGDGRAFGRAASAATEKHQCGDRVVPGPLQPIMRLLEALDEIDHSLPTALLQVVAPRWRARVFCQSFPSHTCRLLSSATVDCQLLALSRYGQISFRHLQLLFPRIYDLTFHSCIFYHPHDCRSFLSVVDTPNPHLYTTRSRSELSEIRHTILILLLHHRTARFNRSLLLRSPVHACPSSAKSYRARPPIPTSQF